MQNESKMMPGTNIQVACKNCALSEPVQDGQNLITQYRCRSGQACAVPKLNPVTRQASIQFMRPVWDADEWCMLFMPREGLLPAAG